MFSSPPKLIGFQDKRRISSELNYGIMRTSGNEVVAVPRDSKFITTKDDFSREWSRILNQYAGLNNRPVQISSYQRMDEYSPLVSRALDAYSDESLGISAMFLPSIDFQINDKNIDEKVRKVIELNGLLTDTRVRSDVRDMCKYGDTAYVFNLFRSEHKVDSMLTEDASSQLLENIPIKQNRISQAFAPEEIIITDLSPMHYSLHGYKGQLYQLTTDVNSQQTFMPWEFVIMSLENKETFPYGRSMIEQGRIPFETLQVAEQLLAMARNSKVSRWVIRVPDGQSVMDDFEIYSDLRASFENMRWGGSGVNGGFGGGLNGGSPYMTRPSDTSLNTIFFVPQSLQFDELRVPIDVSDMEDVFYYRDNLIMGLGLPKGFLMADESDNVRGRALQEQDLVFQRKLPFVQKAYISGVKKMLLLCCYYLGANLDTLRIDVKIKLPHRLSADLLEQYRAAIEYVAELKNLMTEINPYHQMSLEDLNLMVFKAGLDPDIVNIPGLISKQSGDDEENSDVEFGESFNSTWKSWLNLSAQNRKPIVESIGKRMISMLNESWGMDSFGNKPHALLESLMPKHEPYYVHVADVALHSRLYECVIKESWLGNANLVLEPSDHFKVLHEAMAGRIMQLEKAA